MGKQQEAFRKSIREQANQETELDRMARQFENKLIENNNYFSELRSTINTNGRSAIIKGNGLVVQQRTNSEPRSPIIKKSSIIEKDR